MANVRTLKLNLLGDVSDFKKGLNKAEAETKSFSGSLKTSMKTVAKSAAIAGAAVGGGAGPGSRLEPMHHIQCRIPAVCWEWRGCGLEKLSSR